MGSTASAAESQPHRLFTGRCRHVGTVLILTLLAAFGPGGCMFGVYRATFNDAQTDQPWAAPGRKVTARIKVRMDFVRVDEHLFWRSHGREWNARDLANACEQQFTAAGFSRIRHDYDSQGNLVPQQPMTNHSGPYGPGAVTWVYSESMTIVCVDPLIAIICDDSVSVPAFTQSKGVMDHDGEWFVSKIEHSLGDATFYGTKGSCTSNLRWLSPDLKRGPELIVFDQAGVGRIETPWGAIEVRSDAQQWTTTAVSRAKPR